jgi:Uma2 family endonuclease
MQAATRATYEEFLQLEEASEARLEFHDGIVVAMAAPSLAHQRICGELYVHLRDALTNAPCRPILAPKLRVEATRRALVPDLVVVCGELRTSPRDPQALVNPRVIVEVLSPSTADYDLGSKFAHYRRVPGLEEYVTVAQDRRAITAMRRVGDLWRFEDGEGPTLRLESIDVELSFDAIYRDTFGDIPAEGLPTPEPDEA